MALVEHGHRHQDPDRVLHGFAGDDLSRVILVWISRTAARPVSSAATSRSECTAGIAAVPGSDNAERLGDAGHGRGGAHHRAGAGRDREPALDLGDLLRIHRPGPVLAQKPRQSVQAPSRWPRWRPVDIGPVTTWIAGRPAEAAPMSWAGTVLSQPPISTTASIGWAWIISSVSRAMRLRYIMLVGLRKTSPSDTVGTGAAGHRRRAHRGDRLHQLGHAPVAIVEPRRVMAMPTTACPEGCARCPWTGEGPPQVPGENAVAVIGETPVEAVRFGGAGVFAHRFVS